MATEKRNGLAALFGRHDGCETGPVTFAGGGVPTALLDIGFFGNEIFDPAGRVEWDDLRPTAAKRKAKGEDEGEADEEEDDAAVEEEEDDAEEEEDEDVDDDEDLDDEDDDEDEDEDEDDEDEEDEEFDDPDEEDDYDDDEEEFDDEDE